MTAKLKDKFNDYALYHTHPKNRLSHYIGIPMITISLIGLLAMVKLGPVDLGMILSLVAVAFYLSLDRRLAMYFSLVIVITYHISLRLDLTTLIVLQVVGWVAQYIGHLVYEKKSPAFYKNVQHLLIGPLWIFSKAIRYK